MLGVAGHTWQLDIIRVLSRVTGPLGQLWLNALQLVVLPLVVTQMLAAVAGRMDGANAVGRLGLRTLMLIVLFLVLGGVYTVLIGLPALQLYHLDRTVVEAARAAVVIPEAAARAAEAGGGWGAGLVPANLLRAALDGDILGVLLFTVAFGLAVNQLPAPQREPLARIFAASAEAMMVIIRWILIGTPIGVFALMLDMALGAGIGAVGMLAAWVLFVSALLIGFTGVLYPLTAVLGRTSVRVFARAVAPAQLVAMGTRSSLACLPALVDKGREHLRLPPPVTGLVLPLCVTIFKQNRTISSTGKLLFLAHVFGVTLTVGSVAAFFLTVLLLSFSSVGIPRGGAAFTTLPAYLAAGIPVQGLVLLEAVETIPDFFKTVLNVTADMSLATVVAAQIGRPEAAGHVADEPVGTPQYAG